MTILQNELNNTGGAYTTTNITKTEHVDSLCKWFVGPNMNGTSGKSNNDFLKDVRLSSMYWLPKLHKTPVGTRFIAASSDCTTTFLSKLLARVFQQFLDTLRCDDDKNLRKNGGVRRFFVVHSHEEVTRFFSRWRRSKNRHHHQLHTGDFSTMYTTIPHQDLLDKMKQVTEEVFKIAKLGCNDDCIICRREG